VNKGEAWLEVETKYPARYVKKAYIMQILY
jgi:hypothetical protein